MMFDYISQAWYFYRTNFFSLLSLAVPFAVISTCITLALGLPIEITDPDQPPIVRFNTIILTLIFSALYTAAKVLLVKQLSSDSKINLSNLISTSLANWPRILLLQIIMQLITFIGLLLFILPGLWAWARLSFSPFILLFENQSVAHSLRLSISRTLPLSWKILGSFIVVGGPLFLALQVSGAIAMNLLGETSPAAILLVSITENILFSMLTVLFLRYYLLEKELNQPR